MTTGENEQDMRKILDMTRMISIALLIMHFYFYCYAAFKEWGLSASLSDRLLFNITKTGLFKYFHTSKLLSLVFLGISLLGAKGKKHEKITYRTALSYLIPGMAVYFIAGLCLYLPTANDVTAAIYMTVTVIGYGLLLTGGIYLTRILKIKDDGDVFNRLNESFPQEERLLKNQYSVNIPAIYYLKGEKRSSYINLINLARGLILTGSPGSGKSRFIMIPLIKQQIMAGYAMLLYDFKYDDLSKIGYNYFCKYRHKYPPGAGFFNINFDDLNRTHRCNPLHPSTMSDITDAAENSRTILLGLNMSWIEDQGDFFVESPINFVTALIWFLCRYNDGKYCTWAHVIEMAQAPYKKLFSVLRTLPELSAQIGPFINAYLNNAAEQLEGQIASATISLAKLSSPQLYYVLSGNDFTLDLNHPEHPKVVCLGNNPQKTGIYGAILSVYINTITRLANRKGRHHFAINIDEFSSVTANSIDKTIATGRSNKIAVTLALQDSSQLRLAYGKEFAEVIFNTCGNIISGQVTGDTAKQISERVGKIMQDRVSYTTTSTDTNFTQSKQLELAVPASRVSTLSSGEFVGIVADNPGQEIDQKVFHCKVVLDDEALELEEASYRDLPLIRKVTKEEVYDNYMRIKNEVNYIIESEIERIMDTPALEHLLIKK